ncbi:hypothetical protein LCGC14_1781600 [marine sediment metagenome]|uniref:Uncharacterized protein n=1 Tax=marine sediment metagenome TaxID=412755 RepID=A0A0F9GV60_9ZZZZ
MILAFFTGVDEMNQGSVLLHRSPGIVKPPALRSMDGEIVPMVAVEPEITRHLEQTSAFKLAHGNHRIRGFDIGRVEVVSNGLNLDDLLTDHPLSQVNHVYTTSQHNRIERVPSPPAVYDLVQPAILVIGLNEIRLTD